MSDSGDASLDRGDGITRRDFLDGVAITAAGLAAAAAAPHLTGAEAAAVAAGHTGLGLPPGYYPPTKTGLKGHPNRVVRQIMKIDGPPNPGHPHSNVSIANSDSGAFAYTHSAINEAYRAIQDLP